MIVALSPTIEQQIKTLDEKLARIDREIESLHIVADPISRRLTNLEHVRHFLHDALAAVRCVEVALKSVADGTAEPIPF